MQVGIVAQKGNSRAAFLAGDLVARLDENGVSVHVDEATAEVIERPGTPVSAFSEYDLVVSIGGDGTFLYAARGANGTPVLGVNLGEVGFLNAVSPADAVEAVLSTVTAFRAGDVSVQEVPRLEARGAGWESRPAVNEVVVMGERRGHGGGIGIEVRVDGELYTGGHADGVLVSTPTGSTAYNLSEGGPLVHPEVESLVVTEMAAEAGMPPLVVPLDSEVSVTVTGADAAIVASDGDHEATVEPPAEVTVATTDPPVRRAGPASNFFEALGKLD